MGLSVIGNASLIGAAYFGGAAIISAGAAASGAAVSAPYVTFGMRALQHAFSRGHAADFGITGNWSKANAALFRQALQSFVTSNNTQVIQGTYRGTMQVYHFYDRATRLWVATDLNGNFIAAWKLSQAQLQHLLTHGNVQ